MSASDRTERLRRALEAQFSPAQLIIEDESHRHAGHAGAAGGMGHFRIRIVAEAFRGMPPVMRHRQIYGVLEELLKTDIHALAIEALVPEDG